MNAGRDDGLGSGRTQLDDHRAAPVLRLIRVLPFLRLQPLDDVPPVRELGAGPAAVHTRLRQESRCDFSGLAPVEIGISQPFRWRAEQDADVSLAAKVLLDLAV